MSRRIIVLPEELEVIENRLEGIEKALKKEQHQVDDPILNTDAVMALLKISRRSLQNWRDHGLIEFSPIGGKFYYRMSAIIRMLDENIQRTTDIN